MTGLSRKYVLLDIDGCCADSSLRQPHFETDFEKYIKLHHTDQPILAGVVLYRIILDSQMVSPIFITSRTDFQREETELLLTRLFGRRTFSLLMRKHGDESPCEEVKLKLLIENGIDPAQVLFAIDDLPPVIKMYHEIGIRTFKAPSESY